MTCGEDEDMVLADIFGVKERAVAAKAREADSGEADGGEADGGEAQSDLEGSRILTHTEKL